MRSSLLAVLGTCGALAGMLLMQVSDGAVDVELVAGQVVPLEGATASDYVESKLIPFDEGPVFNKYGNAVAVSDDGTVVVGAPFDDDRSTNAGAAYVFRPDGTGSFSQHKLTGPSTGSFPNFGDALAISGDGTIVVGAHGDSELAGLAGAVHIFKPDGTGGYESTKLFASDGASGDQFGHAVAITADGHIFVGAPRHSDTFSQAGAVYHFSPDGNNGYGETKILHDRPQAAGDFFGFSVAVSPNGNLAVGARFHEGGVDTAGAVYLYRSIGSGLYDATELQAAASGPQPTGSFEASLGSTVAVDDSGRVAAGMENYRIMDPPPQQLAPAPGAVVVFAPNDQGGFDETVITAIEGDGAERFGAQVSISMDGTIAASASQQGALHILSPTSNGYSQVKLTPSDHTPSDTLGVWPSTVSISPSGQYSAIGGRRTVEPDGQLVGLAYRFRAPVSDGFLDTGVQPTGDVGVGPFNPNDPGAGAEYPDCLANVSGDAPHPRVCFLNSVERDAYVSQLLAPEHLPRPPDEVIWIGGYDQEPVKP